MTYYSLCTALNSAFFTVMKMRWVYEILGTVRIENSIFQNEPVRK